MIDQHITVCFDTITITGDKATDLQQELLTDGLSFSRPLLEDLSIDDPDQIRLLTSFDNDLDRNDVEDILPDEFQFLTECRDEYEDCELVDYSINWTRSEID